KLQDVVPPTSYTMVFDGQGGAAGFGKGSADVRLAPDPEGTRLSYTAKAQVGGKLAQVGSRLIDGAAANITDDFFSAFTTRLSATGEAVDETIAREPGAAPAADGARAPTAARSATRERTVMRWVPWIVAIVVIAALLAYWRG